MKSCSIAEGSTPGTGICVPIRNTANIISVNIIRCLSSGILKIFDSAVSTSDNLRGAADRRDFFCRRFSKALRFDCQFLFQLAASEDSYAVEDIFEDTDFDESDCIDCHIVIENVERSDVDFRVFFAPNIFEAALRQSVLG